MAKGQRRSNREFRKPKKAAAVIGQRIEKFGRDLTSAYLRHGLSLQRRGARSAAIDQ